MGSALIWYDGSADADRAIRHARALLRETRAVLMHAAERASDAEAAARARALEEGFDPIATVKATRARSTPSPSPSPRSCRRDIDDIRPFAHAVQQRQTIAEVDERRRAPAGQGVEKRLCPDVLMNTGMQRLIL